MKQKKVENPSKNLSTIELDHRDTEYFTVCDKVLNYIVPAHNWQPKITNIEKVTNPKMERRYN